MHCNQCPFLHQVSSARRSFAFISGSASFSNSKRAPLPLVDILKVSDEELPLLIDTTDCAEGTAQLAQNGIRLIFVTLGANGVFYRFGDKTGHVAGAPCKQGDINGAGDTFFGAALSKLCKEELDTLTVDKLEGILAFANKAASITTSRHGAIPAMPILEEVEK